MSCTTFLDRWWKISGVTLVHKPKLRIAKYDSWKVHFITFFPFLPWTPWFQGTLFGHLFLWVMIPFWCGYMSWVGFSDDPVASALRIVGSFVDTQPLVIFLLGYCARTVLARWWRMRELAASISGGGTETGNMLGSFSRAFVSEGGSKEPEHHQQHDGDGGAAKVGKLRSLRNTAVRLFNLLHAISMHLAGSSHINYDELLKKELLTAQEATVLQEAPAHATTAIVLVWISQIFHEVGQAGLLCVPNGILNMVTRVVGRMNAAANDIGMFVQNQLPYCYVQLLSFIVQTALFLTASSLAPALNLSKKLTGVDRSSAIFWTYFVMVLWVVVLKGMLILHVFFENPYGDDPSDFPVEQNIDKTWGDNKKTLGLLDENTLYPLPLPLRSDPFVHLPDAISPTVVHSAGDGAPGGPTNRRVSHISVNISDPSAGFSPQKQQQQQQGQEKKDGDGTGAHATPLAQAVEVTSPGTSPMNDHPSPTKGALVAAPSAEEELEPKCPPLVNYTSKWWKLAGIKATKRPSRILSYDIKRTQFLSFLPFIPWTPWYRGTFFHSIYIIIPTIVYLGFFSWIGWSDDLVAGCLRVPTVGSTTTTIKTTVAKNQTYLANVTLADNSIVLRNLTRLVTTTTSQSISNGRNYLAGLAGSQANIQSLTIFLLGMYVTLILGRWWAMRNSYSALTGRCTDVIIMLSAYMVNPPNTSGDHITPIRKRIIRMFNLAHALLVMQANGISDPAKLFEHKLCTPEEWKVLQPLNNRYSVALLWGGWMIGQCADRGMISCPDTVLPRIQKALSRARSGGSGVCMYLGTQLPYAYTQVLSFMIHSFLFISCSSAGYRMRGAKGLAEHIFWPYVHVVTWTVAFQSFLIFNMLFENPYGEDATDFATEKFAIDFASNTKAISNLPSHLPATAILAHGTGSGGAGDAGGLIMSKETWSANTAEEVSRSSWADCFWHFWSVRIVGLTISRSPHIRILHYSPWRVHFVFCSSLIPVTPWFKGTLLESKLMVCRLLVYLGLLSWLGWSPDPVANVLRQVNSQSIQALTTFVLGTYASLVLGRWWRQREVYQSILGMCTDLAIRMCAYIQPRSSSPTAEEMETVADIRKKFVRLLNLFIAISTQQCSGKIDLPLLVTKGLLTTEEQQSLEKGPQLGSKFIIVYLWIATLTRQCAEQGFLVFPEWTLARVQSHLSKLRSAPGDILTFQTQQLPFCYVQILSQCVTVFLFMITCSIGKKLNNATLTTDPVTYANGVFWSFLETTLWSTVFYGLLALSNFLENPFGKDACDFPTERLMLSALRGCWSVLDHSLSQNQPQRALLLLPPQSSIIMDPSTATTAQTAATAVGSPAAIPGALGSPSMKAFNPISTTAHRASLAPSPILMPRPLEPSTFVTTVASWWWKLGGVVVQFEPVRRILRYKPWVVHFPGSLLVLPLTPNLCGSLLGTPYMWMQLAIWWGLLSWVGWSEDPVAATLRLNRDKDGPTISNIQSLVTFLLGLYVSTVLDRWWKMRSAYQAVSGRCIDLMLMASAYIRAPKGSDPATVHKAHVVRATLFRYLNLANNLVLQNAGGHYKPPFTPVTYQAKGLVTEEEWKILENYPAKLPVVIYWITDLVVHAATTGLMTCPESMLPSFHAAISKLRGSAGDIAPFIETQLPFMYIQFLSFATHVFMCYHTAQEAWFLNKTKGDEPLEKISTIFWSYLMVGAFSMCFEGLLVLHVLLENPFGNDPCDFPVEQFVDGLYANTYNLLTKPSPTSALTGPQNGGTDGEKTKISHQNEAEIGVSVDDEAIGPKTDQEFELAYSIVSAYDKQMRHEENQKPFVWTAWWWKLSGIAFERHPLRLKRYSPMKVYTLSPIPILPWTPYYQGSIFYGPALWLLLLFWLGLISWLGFSDDGGARVLRHTFITETKNVQNLTTFTMGLFVALLLGRWWDMRESTQKIHTSSIEVAIMVATYLRVPGVANNKEGPEHHDRVVREVNAARRKIRRWLTLAHTLFLLQARGNLDSSHLLASGLVTSTEWAILEPIAPTRVALIYQWIAHLLAQSADHGLLHQPVVILPRLQKHLGRARASGAAITMYLTTALPYQYIQVLSFLVHFFLFVAACSAGNRIDVGLSTPSSYGTQAAAIVYAYVLVTIWVVAFEGLLWLNVLLRNPFHDGAINFSIEHLCDEFNAKICRVLKPTESPAMVLH